MSETNFQLRTLTFIDSLQPQLARVFAQYSKVAQPQDFDAALLVEVAPAMAIHSVIDAALKNTQVRLGSAVTERHFGLMLAQHKDQGEVKEAGRAVLRAHDLCEYDRANIEVLTNRIIRGIETDHTTMFDNSGKNRAMPNESLIILETKPAAYIAIACNEALKAANVKLIEVIPCGATGRLIMSGSEAEIDSAMQAALGVIQKLNESLSSKCGTQLG